MSQSAADVVPYNTRLSNFGIAYGSGGMSFADKMAPPTDVPDQAYSVPHFAREDGKGKTNDTIGPDGRPNVRETSSITLVPGRTERRGLRAVLPWELQFGPMARFFASAQSETEANIDNLRFRMEKKVHDAVLARASVSGYYASPSVKWDAASLTGVVLIADAEAAVDAAEANARSDEKGGFWEFYTNKTVARAIGAYYREVRKYGDSSFIQGGIIPLQLAGLPLNVAGVVENAAKPGQTPTYASVWSEDNIYLVYSNPSFSTGQRAYTAMAQMRWSGLTRPYGTKVFNHPEDDVYETIVSTDIYDSLEILSVDGVYVLPNVLTA